MSQGLRGRLRKAACYGFGLLVCSGTLGCMGDKKLPMANKNPSTGLPGTPMVNGSGNASRPGQPGQANQPPFFVNGQPVNGASNVNLTQRGGAVPPGGANYGGANPNNFGTVNSPTVPGYSAQPASYNQPGGYGQPASYNQPNSVVPSVTPTGSATPSPRNVAMVNPPSARGQGPELSPMTDLGGPIPPAQPGGTLPSVAPSGYLAPVAPPSPSAPVAPPYPGR